MATLCKAYPSEPAARRAIEGLQAAGLPPQGAQLITGTPVHDLRREPVGEFAKTVEPDAPVGTFGDVTLRRWRPAGSFAGDPDRRREGSFGDVDRQVVVTHDPGGGEHEHIAGRQRLERLLLDAGLEHGAVERAVADVHGGKALVLVQIAEMGPEDAVARLEEAGAA